MVMQKIGKLCRSKKGQGMTEYIIIVALIAIAAIMIFTLFGDQIRNVVGGMGDQISGKTDAEPETTDFEAQTGTGKDVTMGNFENEK